MITFDEVLREWVVRNLEPKKKDIKPEDKVFIEYDEGNGCPTCGYNGFVQVVWKPVGVRRLAARRGYSWSFHNEEGLVLLKELVVLSAEMERDAITSSFIAPLPGELT